MMRPPEQERRQQVPGAIQFVNSSSGDFVELGAAAGVVGGGSGQPLLTSMVSSLTGSDDTFFTATSSAASEAFFTELRFRRNVRLVWLFYCWRRWTAVRSC